jgi:BirA family biotin operon repressor/biotin-[acetyl-CoA-carboxylase] ligase
MTAREEWHLGTRHIGQRVLVFDQLDSTNTRAAQYAADTQNHGLVIVAEDQTAGRGQHGRDWQAPAGRAVLMSILLFPPPALRRPALLTAWAAVAVCDTIRQATGLEAKIKWPNDVLLRGRKVCGILIESKIQNALARPESDPGNFAVVVGIGLNVNQTPQDFEKANLPQAGSLALFSKQVLDCATVGRLLVDRLDEEYDRLVQGDFAGLEASWKQHLGLLGKQVAVECVEGRHWGRLRELNLEHVELEKDEIGTIRLISEAIQHIEPA